MSKPLQSPWQSFLYPGATILWTPSAGTVGTGAGFGGDWSASGTITHPDPSTAAPAKLAQMKRTRFTNVAATTNQELGVRFANTTDKQFWRGNASGLGGFYAGFRFFLAQWPSSQSSRLFAGMTTDTTPVVSSDSVGGHCIGLWHDSGDGASALSVVTRDNVTSSKTSISGVPGLANSQGFDFHIFCVPNGSAFAWRLDDLNTGLLIQAGAVTATIPGNTAFLGPQCELSNGTANTAVDTTTLSLVRIYCASEA